MCATRYFLLPLFWYPNQGAYLAYLAIKHIKFKHAFFLISTHDNWSIVYWFIYNFIRIDKLAKCVSKFRAFAVRSVELVFLSRCCCCGAVDVAAVLLLPLLRWTQDTEAGPCGHVPYILALHWLPLRDFGTICLPCFAPFLLLRKERGRLISFHFFLVAVLLQPRFMPTISGAAIFSPFHREQSTAENGNLDSCIVAWRWQRK